MDVSQTQVYGLARRLEEAGELERRDGALFPAAGAPPAAPAQLEAPAGAQGARGPALAPAGQTSGPEAPERPAAPPSEEVVAPPDGEAKTG